MHRSLTRVALASLLLGGLGAAGSPASAGIEDALDDDMPGRWRLAVGPFTQHLHNKPEYEYVWSVAIERQRDDGWMYGASYFSNSFGQACGYLYVGEQVTQLFAVRELFFQWSAGLIYGYKGEYSNRVPLNTGGFAPGAVFSLGWQFDRSFGMQINKVGTSGFMLQLSYTLP